jgi:Raf kinase inhibitor-like YbhB/YbcL family protein
MSGIHPSRVRAAGVIILLLALVCGTASAGDKFALSSPDFAAGGVVPQALIFNAEGCSGGNQSPELHWQGAPAGTKSYAITVFDRDERGSPSGWWHWVIYDLPATTTHLARGAGAEHSTNLPSGAIQGRTDLGTDAYHGPCPDRGDPAHHYVITIYALSVDKLAVPAEASGAMVSYTARGVTLASASLVGRYQR